MARDSLRSGGGSSESGGDQQDRSQQSRVEESGRGAPTGEPVDSRFQARMPPAEGQPRDGPGSDAGADGQAPDPRGFDPRDNINDNRAGGPAANPRAPDSRGFDPRDYVADNRARGPPPTGRRNGRGTDSGEPSAMTGGLEDRSRFLNPGLATTVGGLQARLAEQGYDSDEYDIVIADDGTLNVEFAASDRGRAAEAIEAGVPFDVDPAELVETQGGGFQVPATALPRSYVAEQHSEQLDEPVDASDLTFRDGAWRLNEAFRREQAAEQFSAELGGDIDRGDVNPTDDGYTVDPAALPASYVAERFRQAGSGDAPIGPAAFVTGDDVAFRGGEWQLDLDTEAGTGPGEETPSAGVLGQVSGAVGPNVGESGRDAPLTAGESRQVSGALQTDTERRTETLQAIDDRIDEQAGTNLKRGEDYTVSYAGGGVDVTLTKQGRVKAAGAPETGESWLDRNMINPALERTGLDEEIQDSILATEDGDVVQNLEAQLQADSTAAMTGAPGAFAVNPESVDDVVAQSRDLKPQETTEFYGYSAIDIQQRAAQGLADISNTLTNPAGTVAGLGQTIETAGEIAFTGAVAEATRNPPEDLDFENENLTNINRDARQEQRENVEGVVDPVLESFEERPIQTAATVGGGLVLSLAGGRAIGVGSRILRDRVRTVGGSKVDISDVAPRDVLEGDAQFPGADNPALYRSDPPEAVRRQSRRYTPDAIDDTFEEAGIPSGATLKKALDVEPDSSRRGVGGFRSPDVDADDFDYEAPGAFFSPAVSPYFFRAGTRYSLRPGLPDFGGRPTGVVARTDVEASDADDLAGFQQELLNREGETTAVTKPASAVSTGEIEAVVPPGAEFSPVRSGGAVSGLARRLGIGSDYYTTFEGRRIPLRLVAPSDRVDVEADDVAAAARGDADADVDLSTRRPPAEYSHPLREPTDRPFPVYPGNASSSAEAATASDMSSVVDAAESRAAAARDRASSIADPSITERLPGSSVAASASEPVSPSSGTPTPSTPTPSSPTAAPPSEVSQPPSGGSPSSPSSPSSPGSPGTPGSPGSPGSPGAPGAPGSPSSPARSFRAPDPDPDDVEESPYGFGRNWRNPVADAREAVDGFTDDIEDRVDEIVPDVDVDADFDVGGPP